jgi:nitrogen fixation NifU-like protein
VSELSELYQDVILDHNRKPRNFRELPEATRKAEGYNPLCGDHLTVYLRLDGDVIRDISFLGSGCAISKASASLMTSALKGKTAPEAGMLFDKFRELVTSDDAAADAGALGKLAVFSGVREFPSRVKCASLAWHTMRAALDGKKEPVSTELDAVDDSRERSES